MGRKANPGSTTGIADRVGDAKAGRLLGAVAAHPIDVLATTWIDRLCSIGRMTFAQDLDRARQTTSRVVEQVRDPTASGDIEAPLWHHIKWVLGRLAGLPTGDTQITAASAQGGEVAAGDVGNTFSDGCGANIAHIQGNHVVAEGGPRRRQDLRPLSR